jgi:hypothetical protein
MKGAAKMKSHERKIKKGMHLIEDYPCSTNWVRGGRGLSTPLEIENQHA